MTQLALRLPRRAQGVEAVRRRRNWFWVWGGVTLASILSLAGSLMLGSALPSPDPLREPLLWIGAIAALIGLGLGAVNQVVNRRDEARRSRAVTEYNDNLHSIHAAVEDLLRSSRDTAARDAFLKTMVRQASRLFGMNGVRVCVYVLESAEVEGENSEVDDAYLRLADFDGRGDQPRPEFRSGSDWGDHALATASGTTAVCVHDLQRSIVPVDRAQGSVWKSFFSVPIRTKREALGLLNVDTRASTKFTLEDLSVANMIAQLIALGMQELRDAAVETTPEVSAALRRLTRARQAEESSRFEGPSSLASRKDRERK